ncbi:magnesium transporter [Sulfitobacter pseudonitzschiae]|uniref:Magnesium transporter MgtE n=1 Tax=Pseudosulfitobacter pseudonitzschiae TaxID=1402135 RepID=A0A9Q2NGL2_9RHOB|nr:magnesium transporter [Pseudosulfitobacter pseudonitzschiae]MBM2291415.1 magnesium transporter [Pseudosulfitobacter pseudonitzschiae]MBM2296333.1 magnesium transporter [Pseudosulfitobacter pseudonitzschiae]MBM2301246.1 magnesium transporter [Pseudosulfitobacter pseudonitzschiae]MBM2311030.1 magnesium transporter [Pseudosulfitobacter pseudonitzschiae]MBM2315943.1 magnesium transporter [Pseudosulfitobacter pseudonitzschiae]
MADEFDTIEQDAKVEQERSDEAYQLDRKAVSAILYAVDIEDQAKLIELMEPLHPADIADLLEQINAYDRSRLIRLYDREFDGDILSELDESIRDEVIAVLTPQVLTQAVRDLDSDDVVDLVEDMDDSQQEAILDALEDADRLAVKQALSYPEFSAGRLMQREVVMAPEHWTVGDAIDHLRSSSEEDLPDQFYHIVVVDPRLHPVGNVTLGKVMRSRRDVPLLDIVEPTFQVIPATQPESDVAYAFNQYHLISAPVVDDEGRLIGLITIDDAMAVLDEEHEEDIMRLAGVGEGSLSDRVIETTKQRMPWLAVNLLTSIAASLVIAQFEVAIAQIVALAVLMPIVASMGGNAGTQSLTVAVRAIATKDLTGSNVWRVIRREVLVGLFNGLLFAVVMGVVGLIWFGSPALGYVIAAAMVVNMVVAGFAGTVIPVILDRVGVDPALASGSFVTTVTDVVGFFSFLGLAAAVLL